MAADDRISVSFSVSDNYAQHLAVVIASVLVNNPKSDFVFHVLHRNITPENERKVKELEAMYPNCRVEFHKIDASQFEKFPIPEQLEHVTQEMYYRYILPEVLKDEDRTIYSDVDVLCVGDLKPLWELDLQGNILAAVSEGENGELKKRLIGLTGDAPYFYSGLLVMDLQAMREGDYARKQMETTVAMAGQIAWPDQDVINTVFRNKILQLGPEWDGINVRYNPFKKGIVIWHFPGFTMKPWCNIWKNKTWPIYLKYLLKSPYRANAFRFIWGHIKGFFWFSYTKKGATRYLWCGILVYKRKSLPSCSKPLKLKVTRGILRRIRKKLGVQFEIGKYKIGPGSRLEPPCDISQAVDLRGEFSVGAFTTISPTDGIGRFLHNVTIGRYCSIAAGVWIAPDDHPIERLTTNSLTYSTGGCFTWARDLLGRDFPAAIPAQCSRHVEIGNDVWIGHNAFIKGGIKIGDGAVVAAHAVVVKDVPPYAIVGGVPAKIIRYRFDEATIKELLELKWWNYDLASFGDLDWADIKGCISRIKEGIAKGVAPYSPKVLDVSDLRKALMWV
jgi:lipopolysaccharide biosynthesis glycosyltransferase/acetyltransferase-like isoleucine patch superfamily enzyme